LEIRVSHRDLHRERAWEPVLLGDAIGFIVAL
jgi:hypothetical protein